MRAIVEARDPGVNFSAVPRALR